jgi:hypothetical protein
MKIVKNSHAFVVTSISSSAEREAVRAHCIPLLQRESFKKPNGDIVYGETKKYYSFNKDKTECRFHINDYQNFMEDLRIRGVKLEDVEIVETPLYSPTPAHFKINEYYKPRDNQPVIIQYFLDPFPVIKMCELETGGGKAEHINEPVLTPTGWRRIGDLRVGDEVICPDNAISKIIGVFPQGIRPLYRVTLYDGRSTLVDKDHLWKYFYVNAKPENKRWRIDTTEAMKRHCDMANPRVYLPLVQPLLGKDKVLPLDPYLLGVLLGDGCLTWQRHCALLSNPEKEIIDRLIPSLTDLDMSLTDSGDQLNYSIQANQGRGNSQLKPILEYLGLVGTRSDTKFIPVEYLDAKLEDRWELIRGLMDTDGYASDKGTISFTSTSYELAKGLQDLIWGMGDICTMVEKEKYYTYKGERKLGKLAYQLNIRARNPELYFNLGRKKARAALNTQYRDDLKARVKTIEYERDGEAVCISIDHPEHLYITRDYIVTHNTFTSLFSLSVRESRGMLSIRPQYFDNWYKAIFGDEEAGKPPITDLTPDRMLTIQGSIQLKDAIRRATEGDFDYDFIMISNVTLYKMFKVYEELGSTVDVYGCEPWELCQVFGIGTFMKDEGHLDFHANYRLDLFLHVPVSITLSGTFSSENVFIKRMQLLQHPQNSRAPTIAPTKFRAVKAVRYSIDPRRELRYKLRGRSEYNHNQLEESILKDKRARNAYLELIRRVFENEYLKVRTAKDQKALILCGRVEMAEVIIQHLVEHYPELTIGRYVSGDSFMEAITNEVLVTTIISGKAAIDVPNLILAFNTVNVGSKETNLQALGRIRELKHIPEIRPQFVYLYTDDISSASYYHQHKIQLFASRVFSHHTVDSGVML